MTRRLFLLATIAAAVALIAAERAAKRMLPRTDHCARSIRNSLRFRNWPEYIAGIDDVPTHTATCVILSNSQAFAGEYPDYKTYPKWLEDILNENRTADQASWKVLNFSADGITDIELMILAAWLRDYSPAMVLAVTGFADYNAAHAQAGFLYCRSDIPRLAVRKTVAKRLPSSFWKDHGKVEDTLSFLLRDRSPLVRWSEYQWSWLETRFPGAHQTLYAPAVNYLPWDLPQRHILPPLRRLGEAAEEAQPTYNALSRSAMAAYFAFLEQIPAPVLVITQAVRPSLTRYNAEMNTFRADARAAAKKHNLSFSDLVDSMPEEAFISSSHLRDRYQRPYAEKIADAVSRTLSQETGRASDAF